MPHLKNSELHVQNEGRKMMMTTTKRMERVEEMQLKKKEEQTPFLHLIGVAVRKKQLEVSGARTAEERKKKVGELVPSPKVLC